MGPSLHQAKADSWCLGAGICMLVFCASWISEREGSVAGSASAKQGCRRWGLHTVAPSQGFCVLVRDCSRLLLTETGNNGWLKPDRGLSLSHRGYQEVGSQGWWGLSSVIRDPGIYFLSASLTLACVFQPQSHFILQDGCWISIITSTFQGGKYRLVECSSLSLLMI